MATRLPPPKLRPYQVELINDLYRKINEGHKKIAIIAGTGAGKTVISGQICAHAEGSGKRLMFLVHLDVLVGQTYEKMKSFGLHCGFIKAGWEEDRRRPHPDCQCSNHGPAQMVAHLACGRGVL
jgi:superfamily II DNA or RNA helicase